MVGIWKSQTTDIVDLESTVTILTTQVFVLACELKSDDCSNKLFCSSELYCLLAADADRDQMFPTPFVSFLFEKVH